MHTQSAGLAKFHETYHRSDISAGDLVEVLILTHQYIIIFLVALTDIQGIGSLTEVPGHVCVHYFPVLMNELMMVMGSSGKPTASLAAFKAMMIVLSKYVS